MLKNEIKETQNEERERKSMGHKKFRVENKTQQIWKNK